MGNVIVIVNYIRYLYEPFSLYLHIYYYKEIHNRYYFLLGVYLDLCWIVSFDPILYGISVIFVNISRYNNSPSVYCCITIFVKCPSYVSDSGNINVYIDFKTFLFLSDRHPPCKYLKRRKNE